MTHDTLTAESPSDTRIAQRRAHAMRALQADVAWEPPPTGVELPAGDTPGDLLVLVPGHLAVARDLYPRVAARLHEAARSTRTGRTVVAIAGGSGAGKTGVATVLAHQLGRAGLGTLIVSGDNYALRVPFHNDAERVSVFRLAGARGLADAGLLTPERREVLRELQLAEIDAAPSDEHPWLAVYQEAGREALTRYLGTPREIDFPGLSAQLTRFADGDDELWLRRTGRTMHDLWFERVDVHDVDVLLVEWTHGLSEHLHGADVGVYLPSDPAETLAGRLARGRDTGVDSPFVAMVLEIEQAKLVRQSATADVVATTTMSTPSDDPEVV